MKTLIVYYSRTGTTKRAAEIAAKELGADIEELIDKTKRAGILGYLKSGRQAMTKKLTELEPTKKDPKSYELVIIATPLWVGIIPPAIRTYLKNNPLENKKVAILITMSGSETQKEKVVNEIKNIAQKAVIVGDLPIRRRALKDSEEKIKEWAKKIKP
jgi:flavodoxin